MMKADRRVLGIIAALTMFGIMFGAPIFAQVSEYAYSRIIFTVPSVMSFSVSLAGTGANISNQAAPGNQTEDIWFNASNSNTKYVEPCQVGGTTCQDRTPAVYRPILRFTNTGTLNFNLTIQLNTTTPGVDLWANYSNFTETLGCGDWSGAPNSTILSPDTQVNFSRNICPNNVSDVWLFANFTDVPGGAPLYNFLNYSSHSD
jgi:hypothetical protein